MTNTNTETKAMHVSTEEKQEDRAIGILLITMFTVGVVGFSYAMSLAQMWPWQI